MALVLAAITSRNGLAHSAKLVNHREYEDIPMGERVVAGVGCNRPSIERLDQLSDLYALLEPENISPWGNGKPEEFVSQFDSFEDKD